MLCTATHGPLKVSINYNISKSTMNQWMHNKILKHWNTQRKFKKNLIYWDAFKCCRIPPARVQLFYRGNPLWTNRYHIIIKLKTHQHEIREIRWHTIQKDKPAQIYLPSTYTNWFNNPALAPTTSVSNKMSTCDQNNLWWLKMRDERM